MGNKAGKVALKTKDISRLSETTKCKLPSAWERTTGYPPRRADKEGGVLVGNIEKGKEGCWLVLEKSEASDRCAAVVRLAVR